MLPDLHVDATRRLNNYSLISLSPSSQATAVVSQFWLLHMGLRVL